MLLLIMNVNPMKSLTYLFIYFCMHAIAQHQCCPFLSHTVPAVMRGLLIVGKPLQLPGATCYMIQSTGKSSFRNVAELPAANHHNLIQTDIYNVRFLLTLCF